MGTTANAADVTKPFGVKKPTTASNAQMPQNTVRTDRDRGNALLFRATNELGSAVDMVFIF